MSTGRPIDLGDERRSLRAEFACGAAVSGRLAPATTRGSGPSTCCFRDWRLSGAATNCQRTKPLYKDFPWSQAGCLAVRCSSLISGCSVLVLGLNHSFRRRAAGEGVVRQRTDCTSTNGLVARRGAGPDTNRSAGLHSRYGVGRDCRHARFTEFTSCRSDLSNASSRATSWLEGVDLVVG
jgi:hypothetical protein